MIGCLLLWIMGTCRVSVSRGASFQTKADPILVIEAIADELQRWRPTVGLQLIQI